MAKYQTAKRSKFFKISLFRGFLLTLQPHHQKNTIHMDKNNKTVQAPTDKLKDFNIESERILSPAEYKEKRIRVVCVEPNVNSLTSTETDVRPRVTNDGESNSSCHPRRAMFPIITDSAYITCFTDEYGL